MEDFRPAGRGDKTVVAVMGHPTRVRILMAMNAPKRRLTPSRFSDETGLDIRHCAYHFGQLVKARCINLVETRPGIRGSVEHVYEPRDTALAWTSEWEVLSPKVKRAVLTSVYKAAVETLGSAIDGGTFESRDDSHLSWNTIEVDEVGWIEMAGVFDRALEDLTAVEKACTSRIAEGDEFFVASHFMFTFESPRRFDPMPSPGVTTRPRAPRPTKDKNRLRRRELRKGMSEEHIMTKAMAHPTRVRILMAMNSPRRRMSASQFARETGLKLDRCAYHFRELEDFGCIALVDSVPRRGATENIYEPLKTALAWTDIWKSLGPIVKQSVLAKVMRGAVEALGDAIDGGTFEARKESHLSWNTIEIDEIGWTQMATIFDRVLTEMMDLEKRCLRRIAGGSQFIVASFFMATFESPKRIDSLKD